MDSKYRINLNCREAAELLSRERELELGVVERSALRLHLTICRSCRRYRQHLDWLGRFGRQLAEHSAPLEDLPALPDAARQRIASALSQEPT